MTVLLTAGPYVGFYVIALGIAGCVTALRHYIPLWWRDRRRDEHQGADEAYADELHEVRVLLAGEARVPIVAPVPVRVVPVRPQLQPATDRSWADKRIAFARFVDDVRQGDSAALRLRLALETPTAEYRAVVQEQYGVRLDEVGPRETELVARRIEWTAQQWAQAELPIEVTR